jgi:hypothetical protein
MCSQQDSNDDEQIAQGHEPHPMISGVAENLARREGKERDEKQNIMKWCAEISCSNS